VLVDSRYGWLGIEIQDAHGLVCNDVTCQVLLARLGRRCVSVYVSNLCSYMPCHLCCYVIIIDWAGWIQTGRHHQDNASVPRVETLAAFLRGFFCLFFLLLLLLPEGVIARQQTPHLSNSDWSFSAYHGVLLVCPLNTFSNSAFASPNEPSNTQQSNHSFPFLSSPTFFSHHALSVVT
jgi:hypothetical protein